MERIVIEVNKTTAKKWRTSSPKEKRKIAAVLQQAVQEAGQVNEPPLGYARPSEAEIKKHRAAVLKRMPEHKKLLDELSDKAAERGLTPEILDQLLSTND